MRRLLLCIFMIAFSGKAFSQGRYIIKFKEGMKTENDEDWQTSLAETHGVKVLQSFSSALSGGVIEASEAQAKAIAKRNDVEYVEADRLMRINAIQPDATQGIDRIDQRKGRDGQYTFNRTGKGVSIFIIDTGIRTTHQEFTGRIGLGFDGIRDGRGVDDCNGHGTHVAGTAAGRAVGVAKEALVHPVRVMNCDGSGLVSTIIAGIDFVMNAARLPAVANMSLGGGKSQALDDAVDRAITRGIAFAVAAGNSNQDACFSSPAASPNAVTVGAVDFNDRRANFSNFGRCVDIFAPGVQIFSASNQGDQFGVNLSGTSMASPHVAGALALILEANPWQSPLDATRTLLQNATANAVTDPRGSPNRMLFTAP